MSRKYIIEDSSFVISLMNPIDSFHNGALQTFREVLNCGNDLKIVIPSTVFYETMFVLLQNLHYQEVKKKLMNMIMIDQIINHAITETSVLKMGVYADKLISCKPERKVRSNDLMILAVAMSYENSYVLTSDKGMKEYAMVYKDIYCFNIDGERNAFIESINR